MSRKGSNLVKTLHKINDRFPDSCADVPSHLLLPSWLLLTPCYAAAVSYSVFQAVCHFNLFLLFPLALFFWKEFPISSPQLYISHLFHIDTSRQETQRHQCRQSWHNMLIFFNTSNQREIVKTTAQIVIRMNPPMSINLRPRRSISRFLNKQRKIVYKLMKSYDAPPDMLHNQNCAVIYVHSGEFVCIKNVDSPFMSVHQNLTSCNTVLFVCHF